MYIYGTFWACTAPIVIIIKHNVNHCQMLSIIAMSPIVKHWKAISLNATCQAMLPIATCCQLYQCYLLSHVIKQCHPLLHVVNYSNNKISSFSFIGPHLWHCSIKFHEIFKFKVCVINFRINHQSVTIVWLNWEVASLYQAVNST